MLTQDLLLLVTALAALIHALGVLSAIHAVAGVRTSQGAIAWAISLATFPYLALPLYWIFGRNRFHGYVETLRSGMLEQPNRDRVALFLERLRDCRADLPPEWAGDFKVLADGSVAMHGVPVVIADKSAPTISEIVGQARKWHVERGMRVLLVDYLQRIAVPGNAQRHEEIAAIAQSLKNLARDLNVTVIALAQVNRNVESRQDKRPQMGDLADSSGIEKEADQIISLYRDEVYNQNSQDKGIAELDVMKNRHGRTGVLRFAWINETLEIKDLAR